MGIGAALAGGCNLGHSMVGVPLLSMGSIVTTLAMGEAWQPSSYVLSSLARLHPALEFLGSVEAIRQAVHRQGALGGRRRRARRDRQE